MLGIPGKFVKSGLGRQTCVLLNLHPLFPTENHEECYVEKEDQSFSYNAPHTAFSKVGFENY